MSAKSIILKKRNGNALSSAEIEFFVRGSMNGTIPEYQITAWLMAIFFQKMTREEAAALTRAMIDSGERIPPPAQTEADRPASVDGPSYRSVDKHSTGGVGDKISFLVAPLAAAAGAKVPMISGRSLGHTGGTLDKLESIPDFRTQMSPEEFAVCVRDLGFAMAGQTENMVPADRLYYSLRDSASIVESIPLITASILSKKVAEGAESLVLDVKVGSGAFMESVGAARELAEWLVETASVLGVPSRALLTNMNRVLGRTAGNALEVAESVLALRGGPDSAAEDIRELTLAIGGAMLELAGIEPDANLARERIAEIWQSGSGWEKFRQVVDRHGGDVRVIDDPSLLPRATSFLEVPAPSNGVFLGLSARPVGDWITESGGGRLKTSDTIDPVVGVESLVEIGSSLELGTPLVRLHLPEGKHDLEVLRERAASWIEIGTEPPLPRWIDTVGV